jgi:hypothetical protein
MLFMKQTRAIMLKVAPIIFLLGLVTGQALGQPEPFNAFFLPPVAQTEIGQIAEVTFEVDETAMQFNGYEVTIQFDPTIIEFVEAEEGSLMHYYCPSSNWWWMDQTDSTVTLSHVLLCAGVAADGPGELSIWRFRGLQNGLSPLTILNHPDTLFVDAGEWVNPSHPTYPRQVSVTNGAIQVGPATSVTGQAPEHSLRLLGNVPNPFNPRTEIRFHLDRASPTSLEIRDVKGQLIWLRQWSRLDAGRHQVSWDGRDSNGTALPSGVYFYRLIGAQQSLSQRMTLIR